MAEGTLKSERYSILNLDDKYVDEVRCDFITGQSISLFQDNKAKKQLLVDAFPAGCRGGGSGGADRGTLCKPEH